MRLPPFPVRPLLSASLACCCLAASAAAQSSPIPANSQMAKPAPGLQRLLLNPLDEGGVLSTGQWKMKNAGAAAYAGLEPKVGQVALKFHGEAQSSGAKGDFIVHHAVPGMAMQLGAWFHLAPEGNVASLGFQITDAEGEVLFALRKADWTGWLWVEEDVAGASFKQAYKQEGKNGRADLPLKGINLVWFAQKAGPTFVGVDALAAVTQLEKNEAPYALKAVTPASGASGRPFAGQLLVHNYTDATLDLELRHSLQRNSLLIDAPLPDPVLGSNAALGRPCWGVLDGERIDDGSLTDGATEGGYSSAFARGQFTEGFQFVDLGQSRKISALHYVAGDANWAFKMDVAASEDGVDYRVVPGLEGVDFHKKWGRQSLPVKAPFSARYLRFRYHKDGEKMDVVRAPSELFVFDGIADEQIEIPSVGEKLDEKSVRVTVGPRGFSLLPVASGAPLGPGAYLFGLEARHRGEVRLEVANYFVGPEGSVAPRPEGRFGMNVSTPSHIPRLKELGVSWVRFENMKWNFFNPAPGDFRFDGSVAPWNVPFDDYMRQYKEAGFSILPYIMQSPKWSTSAPAGVDKNITRYAPKDYNDYGSAIFEAVARYGSNKVPLSQVKAADPKTGLGQIDTFELWNEPNLNAPAWGFWVGTLESYFDLFRVGAEAARRADPKVRVSHGGFAGLSFDWIDRMRTYVYPDGKTPLDFTDLINVHFYSGKQEPETATTDPNAYRDGTKPEDIETYEKKLVALADWRDALKPQAPIWMTEVGYDVGGPIGRTERHQAAKLPRVLMIALANGVEKVFVYREAGSIPAQHAGAGMLRDDGSVRPVFFTLATLIRQLDGVTDLRTPRLHTGNPKVWAYAWNRGGEKVFTAWTHEGVERLGVDLGRCRVMDAFGAVRETEVGKDFEVGVFPVYITRIDKTATLAGLERDAAGRETKRRLAQERAIKAKAYLYDFGTDALVGSRVVGRPRQFTPVPAEQMYDAAKGHGFVNSGGAKNVDRQWIKSALDRDGVQLAKPATFRIDAAPGVYELKVQGEAFAAGSTLVVSGAKEGEITLALPAEKKSPPAVSASVTVVAGRPIELSTSGRGILLWASLVERGSGDTR